MTLLKLENKLVVANNLILVGDKNIDDQRIANLKLEAKRILNDTSYSNIYNW